MVYLPTKFLSYSVVPIFELRLHTSGDIDKVVIPNSMLPLLKKTNTRRDVFCDLFLYSWGSGVIYFYIGQLNS